MRWTDRQDRVAVWINLREETSDRVRSALIDDKVLAHLLSPENLCRPNDPKPIE